MSDATNQSPGSQVNGTTAGDAGAAPDAPVDANAQLEELGLEPGSDAGDEPIEGVDEPADEEKSHADLVAEAIENPDPDKYPPDVLAHALAATERQKAEKSLEVEKAKVAKLREALKERAYDLLTDEQKAELEDLESKGEKDKYFALRSKYQNEKLDELTKSDEPELSPKEKALVQFNATSSFKLTAEMEELDVPPRRVQALRKQVSDGTLTELGYWQEIAKFLNQSKVVSKGSKPTGSPNLSKAAGSASPTGSQTSADAGAWSTY